MLDGNNTDAWDYDNVACATTVYLTEGKSSDG